MDAPSESNTIAATALFAASVVVDAFTARDADTPAGHAATSLRASAAVLVACLAGPPIREWMLLEQRAAIGVPLIGVALAGAHASSAEQRLGDALYISLVFLSLVYTFWSGGAERGESGQATGARSKGAPPYLRRETLVNLALASLFYSSFRVLRAGLDHPIAASGFTHTSTAYDGTMRTLQGYAHSSSTGVAALCFGAAVGAGTATALFASTELRAHGTAAATLVLVVSATAQLTAAFVATLAQSDAMDGLPAIWSAGACASASLCQPAYEARRLSVVNQSPSALWLNGLGTFVLAYAPGLRFQTRDAMLNTRRSFEMAIYGLAGAAVIVATLISYLSFTGAEALTDYALVGATIAVFITSYIDSLAGALCFGTCLVADIATNWAADGAAGVFIHLSRCYELYLVVLLTLYVVVGVFAETLWRCVPRELVDVCDQILGTLAIAGTSAAAALYLAATALTASYDGQLLDETHLRGPDHRFARTSAAMIVEQWLPLLVWLPLYGRRYEVEFLTARARGAIWYTSALVPVVMWAISLLALQESPTQAVGWSDTGPYQVGLLVVAAAPWSVLVWA